MFLATSFASSTINNTVLRSLSSSLGQETGENNAGGEGSIEVTVFLLTKHGVTFRARGEASSRKLNNWIAIFLPKTKQSYGTFTQTGLLFFGERTTTQALVLPSRRTPDSLRDNDKPRRIRGFRLELMALAQPRSSATTCAKPLAARQLLT